MNAKQQSVKAIAGNGYVHMCALVMIAVEMVLGCARGSLQEAHPCISNCSCNVSGGSTIGVRSASFFLLLLLLLPPRPFLLLLRLYFFFCWDRLYFYRPFERQLAST